MEAGAGAAAGLSDSSYREAGAEIAASAAEAARDADLMLKVRRPDGLDGYKRGAAVVALMDPYGNEAALQRLAEAGLSAFSLELIPRITRAQVMDVLSSQANLAGYQAVIEAAAHFRPRHADDDDGGRHRAGGARLRHGRGRRRAAGGRDRAPARRRRLGHRRAPRRQGAGRLARRKIHRGRGRGVQGGGDGRRLRQGNVDGIPAPSRRRWSTEHIAKQDIVITTALIPGRPAPRLVSREMVASMADGSVIVDLAVERGGNVEGAVPGEVAKVGGVTIIGHLNMAGRIAASSSALLARNIYAFVEPMIDKATKAARRSSARTRSSPRRCSPPDGAIVHPAVRAEAGGRGRPGLMENEALNQAAQRRRGGRRSAAADAAEQARMAAEQAAQIALGHDGALDAAGAAAHVATGGVIDPFVFRLSIFVLAIFVGYYVVWSVTPALHTPLMSVTNAISSVIVVGALLAVGVAAHGRGDGARPAASASSRSCSRA